MTTHDTAGNRGHADPSRATEAWMLAEQLGTLGRWPTWFEAGRLGVELVDHPDIAAGIFHLANGDVVFPTEDGYDVLVGARSGAQVLSRSMNRIHNPGVDPAARVHPTAMVDPTARIEAGAVVGPHTFVGPHAHVGRAAHVGAHCHVGAGTFIGGTATVRGGCIISDGAVIGAGSDLGSCTRIGDGASVAQLAAVESHGVVTSGDAAPRSRSHRDRATPMQVARAVERLLTMDRE